MNQGNIEYSNEDEYYEEADIYGFEGDYIDQHDMPEQFLTHDATQQNQPGPSDAVGHRIIKEEPMDISLNSPSLYAPNLTGSLQKLLQPSAAEYERQMNISTPPAYFHNRPSSKSRKSAPEPLLGEQNRAYLEMREQVNQVRLKTKKKVYAPGQRKPCNCNKSQCLKLYCDCFANGEFCRDCNCKDCHNNINFDTQRSKAIRQSLERNPNAFKPKIGIARGGATADIERLHQKGCHCKKSGCLKNYCECYEAKVPCTDRCKCKGCHNTETYRMTRYKTGGAAGSSALISLTNASGTDTPESGPGSVVTDELGDEYDDLLPQKPKVETDPRRFPWYYMTDEVVEAATMCMVAQAEEATSSKFFENMQSEEEKRINMERLVLREFGRCLEQMITNTQDATAAAAAGEAAASGQGPSTSSS